MTETDEEAVVSKTARVKEEVVVRKDVRERTETVHDTVRREDVEITKEPDAERSTSTADAGPAAPTPKI
jgi:stress response protein YsnF